MSTARDFEPVYMPVGVLTAALQELTPRERRDPDPDLAIEEWLEYAAAMGADSIELSAALHPSLSDIPAEAMLDPVANTLDLRDPFNEQRAERVLAAVKATGVEIADVAYFDNLLHDDPAIRQSKVDFMIATMDAAVLLGVSAVCGFVGRDQTKSMDQNLIEFEKTFVPLLQAAKDRGLQYRVEQCPMPGWTPSDNFHNNIAYTPGTWIALHQICERNGVGDQFRIHYDPSHAILMGQDTRSIFQYLKDEGYDFLIAGMHVKGQVVDSKGVAGWGYGGQTVNRGDWVDGEVSTNPADLANSWKKQTVLCEHELPGNGTARPAGVSPEPHGRLARPPARRTRAARHRLRDHTADRRARVPTGAHPGQGPAAPDPRGLDLVHPQHRQGRRRHVRTAERGARRPGDPDPGPRPPGVQELIDMTDFFSTVPEPIAFAGSGGGVRAGVTRSTTPTGSSPASEWRTTSVSRSATGTASTGRATTCSVDGTFDRPWLAPTDDPDAGRVRQAGRSVRVLRQARHAVLLLPRRRHGAARHDAGRIGDEPGDPRRAGAARSRRRPA